MKTPGKALLIGAQTYGLEGCHNDVRLMERALSDYRFEFQKLTGEKATRAGILSAWKGLIDDTRPSDCVLIYYSGHGMLARYQASPSEWAAPAYYQGLVPTDIARSTEKDFRGILDLELSDLLAKLTSKSKNVNLIFDCCHSNSLCRDLGTRTRSLPQSWEAGVKHHLQELRALLQHELRDPVSNPDAVRLVAAGRHQFAYEYEHRELGAVGMMTEQLTRVLTDLGGRRPSWAEVLRAVRAQVMRLTAQQRPEWEGPAKRALFEIHEPKRTGVLTLIHKERFAAAQPSVGQPFKAWLDGGSIHGVRVGNRYAILPFGGERDVTTPLAMGLVTNVFAHEAELELSEPVFKSGLPAFPVEEFQENMPVEADETLKAVLRAERDESRAFRFSQPGEAPAYRLVRGSSSEWIFDGCGALLFETSMAQISSQLNHLAHAWRLRRLSSGEHEHLLNPCVEIQWGRVEDGRPRPLSASGETLDEGERIYLKITNSSPEELFFHVLDIGLGGNVSLLHRQQASGIQLRAGESYSLGQRDHHGLIGLRLTWPQGVIKSRALRESLLVLMGNRPQDLGALESGTPAQEPAMAAALRGWTPVRGRKNQRDLGEEDSAGYRYAVFWIDFRVQPKS